MKKNILLAVLFTAVVLGCTILISDGMTYLITSLMAMIIIVTIRSNKGSVMKLTRWAKGNPKKAQWFIAGLQLALMGLGIMTGKNLEALGFQFSNTTAYVFSAITLIGFLSIPFISKPGTVAIPKVVHRQRVAYMGIALSSLILMAMIGNRIGGFYPNSPVTQAIDSIDQWIFSDDVRTYPEKNEMIGEVDPGDERQALAVFVVAPMQNKESLEHSKTAIKQKVRADKLKEKKALHNAKKDFRKQLRMAAAGASGGGAVILIILLVITTCAGICLMIFGVASLTSAGGVPAGIVGIVLGAAITYGSIRGIMSLSKRRQQTDE